MRDSPGTLQLAALGLNEMRGARDHNCDRQCDSLSILPTADSASGALYKQDTQLHKGCAGFQKKPKAT